jgi:hypothetical protein
LVKVDPWINTEFDSGVIPNVASNYVSVIWEGFLKVSQTGDYVFSTHYNDGVRLWIDQQLIFDDLTVTQDEVGGKYLRSGTLTLTQDIYIPFKMMYFQNTDAAWVNLNWSFNSGPDEVVPSENFYFVKSHTPISGRSELVYARYTPRAPTNVYQSDSSTYDQDSITLHWTAPTDTGCLYIDEYKIEAKISGEWTQVGLFTTLMGVADLSA